MTFSSNYDVRFCQICVLIGSMILLRDVIGRLQSDSSNDLMLSNIVVDTHYGYVNAEHTNITHDKINDYNKTIRLAKHMDIPEDNSQRLDNPNRTIGLVGHMDKPEDNPHQSRNPNRTIGSVEYVDVLEENAQKSRNSPDNLQIKKHGYGYNHDHINKSETSDLAQTNTDYNQQGNLNDTSEHVSTEVPGTIVDTNTSKSLNTFHPDKYTTPQPRVVSLKQESDDTKGNKRKPITMRAEINKLSVIQRKLGEGSNLIKELIRYRDQTSRLYNMLEAWRKRQEATHQQ